MERLTKKLGPHPFSLIFTGVFAFLFGLLLVYLCIVLGRDRAAVGLNLLVTLLGALSGWALGMFFSPIDARDAKRLQFVGKTVGAFISGYLLAKIDPFLAEQVKVATETPSSVNWVRVGLCVASGLLGAVVVFVNRAYSAPSDTQRPQPSPSLAPGLSHRNSSLKSAS
jgi:type II secretory pathway pseudopilin PulG